MLFFSTKSWKFLAQSPKLIKSSSLFVKKKNFFRKCSPGLVECSFDNHVGFFSVKVQIFFARIPEKIMKMSFLENFLSKMLLCTVECISDEPVRKFLLKVWKIFAQIPKKFQLFFNFLPKLFLSGRTMQFWQTCQKALARSLFFFTQNLKKLQYIYFLQFFILKLFLRTRRVLFWQPHRKILAQSLIKILKFFEKKSEIVSLDTKTWVLRTTFFVDKCTYSAPCSLSCLCFINAFSHFILEQTFSQLSMEIIAALLRFLFPI